MKTITKWILGGIGAVIMTVIAYSFNTIIQAIKILFNEKWVNVPKRDSAGEVYNDEDVIEIKD